MTVSAAPSRFRSGLVLIGCIAACLAFGGLAGAITDVGPGSWYAGLDKPATTPPDWLFGVVWPVLYVLMGIAVWRIWWRFGLADGARPLGLFAVQFAANLAWTPAFFGLQNVTAGAVWILVVLALATATAVVFFRRDLAAGLLLVPYLVWLAYASVVAWGTFALNA
jgi:tryptophan-rich sensory protein